MFCYLFSAQFLNGIIRKNLVKSQCLPKNHAKCCDFTNFLRPKQFWIYAKSLFFSYHVTKPVFLLFPDRWIITERNYWISSVAVSSSFTNRRHIQFQRGFEKLRLLLRNKNVAVSFLGRYASWPYGPSKYSDDSDSGKTKLNLIFLVYFSGPDQSSWSNKTSRYRQCCTNHVPRPGWLHGPWAYPRRYTSKHAGILGTESYDSYDSPSFCAGNLQCSPNGNWQMHFAGFCPIDCKLCN